MLAIETTKPSASRAVEIFAQPNQYVELHPALWSAHEVAKLNQSNGGYVSMLSQAPDHTELDVVDIPISKVKVINRMRRTDENNVDDLIRSIKEIGLLHPIAVAKKDDGYLLLSGMHRLIAMEKIGANTITATVREDDDLINQLVEIEENLCSKKQNAIEEAQAIVLREQILIQLGRKAVVGSNQYTEDKVTNEELAKQLGYTRRTYSYKKSVANLNPEAMDLLSETKFANSMMDMYRLQRLPDHLQLEIAKLLVTGKAKTFRRSWVIAHLKFNQNEWADDIQKSKDELGIPKSVQRWDRKKNKLNDICYFVSHNEDAIVNKSVGSFGTNEIKNYSMCPDQSNWFVNYFSNEGDIVCDPYFGRGTNIIASAYNNRKVIGYDLSALNCELVKTACLENTSIKEDDLTIHNSCGVDMVEYGADSSNFIDLFLTDPPYYGAEDYKSNDKRDLCYAKDIPTFNARFKQSLINMKRMIKPSNFKERIFKPIIIKCGSIRRGDKGLVDMSTEIQVIAKEIGLVLHDLIINELRSATQHYNVGRCIQSRYTVKSHETNLVFVKY